jgi:MarR family transcriptional regulator, temperature-dependent positive regulator of motility
MSDPAVSASSLEILRLLQAHPEYSQRQLSVALGLSLGKTHYILKALLDKGMVKVNNFRRSDNKLGYLYVLTPEGVRHRTQLTREFLAHQRSQFESLRQEIALLEREAAAGSVGDAGPH